MVLRASPCDPDQLRRLAEDRLSVLEIVELEEHLRGCPRCQDSLDRLAGADGLMGAVQRYLGHDGLGAEPTAPAPIEETLRFLAPSDWPESLGRLGPYEIKGVLGRGGMGVVLKAVDPALNRTVAIKVLAPHLAAAGAARQRFIREARAAAAVAHEHVVAVHSVDEAAGLPYLVMEYVPGGSLQDRLDRQGPLALAEVLRIGMQAAAGLAAAHEQGLVHRDVKPANILLEKGVERARLTDFGLARAMADAGLTQSGVVSGTPQYMAPEQARAEAVDHRADLFSLGSTLYAMCTGFPPFRAETAVAVLRRVSDEEPRSLRDINSEVPDWFANLIARLHAKDPAQRYQSAAEVADLLGGCLAHLQQPLTTPLPAALVSGARRRKRSLRGAGWVLAGVVVLAALASAAVVFRPWLLFGPPDATAGPVTSGSVPSPAIQMPLVIAEKADPVDLQIQTFCDLVAELGADINRKSPGEVQDRTSAEIGRVLQRARQLEQEIISVHGSGGTQPQYLNLDKGR